MGRQIPGNGRVVVTAVFDPDPLSIQLANGMAIATNTFSPMAAGIHSSGTPRGFSNDVGYGIASGTRFAGRTAEPLQNFRGAVVPISRPATPRVGAGAGVSGQPGLPSTGQDASGISALQWLGYSQLGRPGLGS